MSRSTAAWRVGIGTALLVSSMAFAPAVGAAGPRAGTGTAAPPRAINVRELARAAAAPGYVAPVRIAAPARPRPATSLPTVTSTAPKPRPATFPGRPATANPDPRIPAPWPGFGEKVAFAGLADSATAGSAEPVVEPPDPWIAVGPNHVVQAVNSTLRISARDGSSLLEVPLADFFLEPGGQVGDGDARVLYDAVRGLWLASELSYDCTTGFVRIAVSDTNDPTLGWHVLSFPFAGSLPDYPGLGLSSDKIVFTANHYAITGSSGAACTFGASPSAASVYSIDWAEVLAGGTTYEFWTPVVGAFSWRPALNLTSDPVVHLVAQGPANEVLYGTITGTRAGGNLAIATTDLTTAGVAAFADPPIPVDTHGPMGSDFVDARPTDALWQAGHLWFVSTAPHSYDGGATTRDVVRVTEISTIGTPSKIQDVLLGDAGFDAYMGGIGLSQVGGLYAVYTQSSASSNASILAAFQGPLATPGVFLGRRILAAGQAGYKGSRWGDYVGVATDPVDPYGVWQADQYTNAAGSWSTRVSQLTEDRTPPVATVPSARIPVPGATTQVAVGTTVSWTGSDDFTGITGYTLQVSVGGSPWSGLSLPGALSTSLATSMQPGLTYRYRVRATDAAGNVGAWAFGPTLAPAAIQETNAAVKYTGTWKRAAPSGAYGGIVKYASAAGASVSLTFTGRQVAWIAPTSPARGSARVYVDGAYKATVSLFTSATRARQVVYSSAWAAGGTHTIKLVVVGTRGHPRVDLDAFVVVR